MRWIRDTEPNSELSRRFRTAMLITFFGNLVLAGLKLSAAYFSGSSAIYADAINSVSDVLYSILLIIGLWLSQQPPDISHPQGHSRFEPFAALIVTLSMAFSGYEALRVSIQRFMEGGASIDFSLPAAALFFSIAVKAIMFWGINRIAQRLSSPGLEAAAKDNITDVITSLAAILGILASNLANPLFDPIAGIIVALWIFRAVWVTAKENLGYLTGAGADTETRQKFIEIVSKIPGVENIHHVITDYAGPRFVVEVHINARGEISLNQAHEICDRATEELEKLDEVDRAYVHVEPLDHT